MTTFAVINPRAWGYIVDWIDPEDQKPLWQQVHENYGHGGGWNDFEGFRVTGGKAEPFAIKYPGDPMYYERARIIRDDEVLAIFPYGWVMYRNYGTGETRIARID